MATALGFEIVLDTTHEEAIDRVTAALGREGFGVLTRIDLDQAFKEKIGKEFRPYTILGACNPRLAHTALTSEAEIGLLLPCNVTVEKQPHGGVLIRFVDPHQMMGVGALAGRHEIRSVADEAAEHLRRVAEHLEMS